MALSEPRCRRRRARRTTTASTRCGWAGSSAKTAEASSFVLEVPADLRAAFAYEAGQFCTFRVWVDGQPLVRCYSMSSSPAVDAELQVTVKRIPGGWSPTG